MDRITRKTLKQDRFAAEVTQSVEYLAGHRRQTTLYGGIAVVVLAMVLGGYFYWQHRKTASHNSLAKAMETYRALVTEEDRPGRVTFKTEADRNAKALKDFEGVVKAYPRTQEGQTARYYIGLVYQQMGDMPRAQQQLEKVASESGDSIPSLARLALADVYAVEGKDELARQAFDYVIKHPSDLVPEARAQLCLVRFLRYRKPEEARKLAQELVRRPGPVASAAGALLRELGQS
jgi:predicted negative regulator of RcsB-dependent stress response